MMFSHVMIRHDTISMISNNMRRYNVISNLESLHLKIKQNGIPFLYQTLTLACES